MTLPQLAFVQANFRHGGDHGIERAITKAVGLNADPHLWRRPSACRVGSQADAWLRLLLRQQPLRYS